MDDLNLHLPKLWYIARLKWIDSTLTELPDVRAGKRNNRTTLYSYTNGARHEIGPRSPHWNEYLKIATLRGRLIAERKRLLQEWSALFKESYANIKDSYVVSPNANSSFGFKAWQQLIDSECPASKSSDYKLGARVFRSRFELATAAEAENLGLIYKYDVGLSLSGDKTYGDFVFGFPEFNYYVVLELMGMLDNSKYAYKRGNTIASYSLDDYVVGKNLFILGATKTYMPSPTLIRLELIQIVERLCFMFVSQAH